MKVLVLGNYAPDRQQSMLRFGALLGRLWPKRGWEVEAIAPESRLLRLLRAEASGRLGKWIGYLDKYVFFPRRLRQRTAALARAGGDCLVHIADHSNAVYIPRRSRLRWVVTCHDLLAVSAARGEKTGHQPSGFGRRLQEWIAANLARADGVGFDSTSTREDWQRLIAVRPGQAQRVVLLPQNFPYRQLEPAVSLARVQSLLPPGFWQQPFLLHVGSNLLRKNKAGAFRVWERVRENWPGHLLYCGAELPAEVAAQVRAAGETGRVHALPQPTNEELEALYNLAHALLFPSVCEGFGWPIIEAQACGCPVICSDRTSLPEIGGAAAMIFGLEDEAGMAEAVRRLEDPVFRAEVIERGLANLNRFSEEGLMEGYAALYEEVLRGARPAGRPGATC